ncbi:hypothetical protein Scep_003763 [Stephania cephalantha]|uniref:HAT C-terminal dimerisation domain-containing protein n=1 Tax=Stephania cephalantha TaxID=152367 RepID=A0AAP0KSQ7_9MAGN
MGYDFFRGDDVSNEQQSELDIYLHEPLLNRKKNLDIIDFWKSVQYRYPKLSMMARDVLAIPLTTVASESLLVQTKVEHLTSIEILFYPKMLKH